MPLKRWRASPLRTWVGCYNFTSMQSGLLIAGVASLLLGAFLSYYFGLRVLRAGLRLANFRFRYEYIARARALFALSFVLVLGAAGWVFFGPALFTPRSPISPSAPLATARPSLPAFTVTPPSAVAPPLTTPTNSPLPPTPSITAFVILPSPAASATNTPTSTPSIPLAVLAMFEGSVTPPAQAEIGRLYFSTEIENHRLVAPATRFGNPIKRMYAAFAYRGLDPGVQWTALWYRDGELKYIDTRVWREAPSGVWITGWEQPPENWLPGTYEVRIFVGSQWKASGTFVLSGNPPTRTPSPTPVLSATPSHTLTPTPTATPTRTPSATPTSTPTRTPSATPTSTPSATPSSTPTSTLTQTPGKLRVMVYFTNIHRLAAGMPPFEEVVWRDIPASDNPIAAVVNEYFKGPTAAEQSRGLAVTRDGFVGYRRIEFSAGILRVYLTGYCKPGSALYNISRPLTATLKQFPEVVFVKIYDEYERTRDPLGQSDSVPLCLEVTFTPTRTPSATPTRTPTSTPSATPTRTPSSTPSATPTSTPSATPTSTPSATPTSTPTRTPSATPTRTPSATPTRTPSATPSSTPTRTPSATPTPSVVAMPTMDVSCNRALFVADVTIQDYAVLHAGEAFTKTWRIRNVGTCTWTTAYRLVFVRGEKMSAPDFITLPVDVLPGQSIDLSVNLVAPVTPGRHQGYWQLQSADGKMFGVGPAGAAPIWVRIRVSAVPVPFTSTAVPSLETPTPISTSIVQPTPVLDIPLDFVEKVCMADWQSNSGALLCPGLEGDPRGFVIPVSRPQLEDGTVADLPALLTVPQFSAEGYVEGIYPLYLVQSGDHFQTTVGCEKDAEACSVLFRVGYVDEGGSRVELWNFGEFYDGQYFNLDLDLSGLAGREVRFVLSISALGSAVGDRALWVAPRIVHLEATTATPLPLPTSTMTASPSPVPPTWTAVPSPTPTFTATPALTPVPSPPATPLEQILERILSFLRRLLGR